MEWVKLPDGWCDTSEFDKWMENLIKKSEEASKDQKIGVQ